MASVRTYSFGWKDSDIVIHYNGDYSGNIEIIVKPKGEEESNRIEVPFAVIRLFMISYIREQVIEKVENVDDVQEALNVLIDVLKQMRGEL